MFNEHLSSEQLSSSMVVALHTARYASEVLDTVSRSSAVH